jgi:Ran GTPase-activating protein (RanGAP) involved in mRNA processing and transport
MKEPFQFISDGISAFINVTPIPRASSRGTAMVEVRVNDQLMDWESLRSTAHYFLQLANELKGRKLPTLGPQHEQILKHIAEKGSISNVEAQAVYRIRSLPRRIKDLKELGYSFKTEMRKDPTGQRYARYSFA